ncbi:acyl-CoA dehydrogenase family protein [Phenylobacterium sp. VNQ135]|uniref:acyl-CoA dehydrogenase family protein n=1 Tax=Phenylobacterium sp. VNQ135 TaxID=3400922 RepID=UPI003C07D4CF
MPALTIEERSALRAAIGRLLDDRSTLADVRRVMDSREGYDAALWRELAAFGLLGLVIDEEYGGAGAGPVELEFIMEEAGAALLCAPFLSSAVLCAELLRRLDDAEASGRLLPEIAAGSVIAAAALTGPRGCWTPDGVAVIASPDAEAWQLDGEAAFVIHGHSANVLLVAARSAGGIDVFEVDPGASGVSLKLLPTFDRTLRLANLTFDGAAARRIGESGRGWQAIEAALDLARVAITGEQAGAGQHVLAFTVDYARTRIQFGRPIGSFQAIKHMAADLLLESESAISAARYAATQLAAAAPDAKAAVELAAFACSEAFVKICADAIQMHGGIAFTWDHPAHLYLRRARADAQLFGAPTLHRDRYLRELEAADG